jgi:hypothetical protein
MTFSDTPASAGSWMVNVSSAIRTLPFSDFVRSVALMRMIRADPSIVHKSIYIINLLGRWNNIRSLATHVL